MRRLSEHVLAEIQGREFFKPGDRVGVAVSGGIDSVALLRVLLELRGALGIVPVVVHFNHGLRGVESDSDQDFVADLARTHGLDFLFDRDDVAEYASQEGVSTEAAARELRYRFFRRLLGSERRPDADVPLKNEPSGRRAQSAAPPSPEAPKPVKLDKIVTGHTLDDQAETVLFRLVRGTGINGLSGIHPLILVEDAGGELCGDIVRPLLAIRRRDLEQYLTEIGQSWREDSTNSDHSFTRNRIRKLVLPLLEKEFNPSVAENLAELAEIARGEQEYWDNEVAGWMGTAVHWIEPDWVHGHAALVQISASGLPSASLAESELQRKVEDAPWLVANASVSRPWFLSEPIAVQRRVVKAIGEHAGIPFEFKHVEDILSFAAQGGHGKELRLPLGWKLVRDADELLFVTPDLRNSEPPQDYEYELTVPGTVILAEVGIALEMRCIPADAMAEYNPDELVDLGSLPRLLKVRNWHSGDRFWPAHTKSPKKIKELLQERHVTRPLRGLWTVIASGEEIVWVRGFPAHRNYLARAGRPAVHIAERRWPETEST